MQHNITAQQATLEFLNRNTTENLQTIVDVVHQLVHIAQNTQDNTQTTAQKTTKFKETVQTNSLMTLEIVKRNARGLPIIQESIQKINNILDELIREPQSNDLPEEEEEEMPHLEDCQQQENQYYQDKYLEDILPMVSTDVASLTAPWDSLPYGRKTRSQEAFLR